MTNSKKKFGNDDDLSSSSTPRTSKKSGADVLSASIKSQSK